MIWNSPTEKSCRMLQERGKDRENMIAGEWIFFKQIPGSSRQHLGRA